jgi:D-psicose/D-tagatose/L-ribulose 3-epimerase
MWLAVSDIAWQPEEDDATLRVLVAAGASGVEVAPTVLWPGWSGASSEAAREYRRRLEVLGLVCPSMQSLLYGRSDLHLFSPADRWGDFVNHMAFVAQIGAGLGASIAVFGSPGNRRRGELSEVQAFGIAAERFREIGELFSAVGGCLCIEPNPAEYGCDFVTTVRDAVELVRAVDHPGFGLHLDAAGMILGEHDLDAAIQEAAPFLRHFHVSQPFLATFAEPHEAHARLAAALARVGFDAWYSIEMRRPAEPGSASVEEAISFARTTYGIMG